MTLSLSESVGESVSDILILASSEHLLSDLVTQLTITDKLRNLIHDIGG